MIKFIKKILEFKKFIKYANSVGFNLNNPSPVEALAFQTVSFIVLSNQKDFSLKRNELTIFDTIIFTLFFVRMLCITQIDNREKTEEFSNTYIDKVFQFFPKSKEISRKYDSDFFDERVMYYDSLIDFDSFSFEECTQDIVNAFDDGTIEGGWGSGNFDDEGNKTQNKQLIKNGVLQCYLVDEFNGRAMNERGNGSCRRESYKYQPTSRMSNTFIGNGTSTKEEIIAATKFGLYAKSLGGGSVNPATGDFNFAVNEGYLVEDGKITKPVKGATLIGNGASILFNIDMVANNLRREQGMCGASSGSIPADVGQPTIRVKSILVGGTGGKIR